MRGARARRSRGAEIIRHESQRRRQATTLHNNAYTPSIEEGSLFKVGSQFSAMRPLKNPVCCEFYQSCLSRPAADNPVLVSACACWANPSLSRNPGLAGVFQSSQLSALSNQLAIPYSTNQLFPYSTASPNKLSSSVSIRVHPWLSLTSVFQWSVLSEEHEPRINTDGCRI